MTTAAKRLSEESHPADLHDAGGELDVQKLRRDFPILRQRVRGGTLVYLDNAATSQKPQVVIDAICRYYERDNANIHRGVHFLSEHATEEYEGARGMVQHFLNAADASEIIFVRGATEAINLVAQTYGRTNVHAGDEVLITTMEHHSNIVPWQLLRDRIGIRLVVTPIDATGGLDLAAFVGMTATGTGSGSDNMRNNVAMGAAGAGAGSLLGYRATGSMNVWMASQGFPAILIELASSDNPEVARNLAGVKAVLSILAQG